MNDNNTIADIIAEMRDEAAKADMEQDYSVDDREVLSARAVGWIRRV